MSDQLTDLGRQAVARFVAERERQIHVEGFTEANDNIYTKGDMAAAAACYALAFSVHERVNSKLATTRQRAIANLWPLEWSWWKPTKQNAYPTSDDRKRCLEKAGALLIAEYERLLRLEEMEKRSQEMEKRGG